MKFWWSTTKYITKLLNTTWWYCWPQTNLGNITMDIDQNRPRMDRYGWSSTWPKSDLGWFGGFLKWGYPFIAGWFLFGRIPSFEMDDNWGYRPMDPMDPMIPLNDGLPWPWHPHRREAASGRCRRCGHRRSPCPRWKSWEDLQLTSCKLFVSYI